MAICRKPYLASAYKVMKKKVKTSGFGLLCYERCAHSGHTQCIPANRPYAGRLTGMLNVLINQKETKKEKQNSEEKTLV
ncbi:MAG: hypothetical protein R2830_15275 [Saprospiraceae bacterium]